MGDRRARWPGRQRLVGLKIKPSVRNERTSGQKINIPGTLRLEQQQAADAITKHDLRVEEIGQIGAGKAIRTGIIDVAVIQSLYCDKQVKDFVADYGHIVVDECHHLSAFTFESVMRAAKPKFVIGLTATPTRKDGHHPIMYMQGGPARFSMSARSMTESSPFDHVVIPPITDFQMRSEAADITIQDVYAAIATDTTRNESILRDLIRAVRRGRSPLLLTGRTERLSYFEE